MSEPRGGRKGEAELLRSCYRESLRLAETASARTIAFPCISTGAYRYPKKEACDVAVTTVSEWLVTHTRLASVLFCCYDAEDAGLYRERLG